MALQLALVVPKSKRYLHGTFTQLLKELRRKVNVHNKKLEEIGKQVGAVMQGMQSQLEEEREFSDDLPFRENYFQVGKVVR